jgi:PIN domain nuclease of toxin-antitoxin system
MKYLMDTHALIWAALVEEKLSPVVRDLIAGQARQIVVSAVSFWEISIKTSYGKFEFSDIDVVRIPRYAHEMGFTVIDIAEAETTTFYKLPVKKEHRDPFDRMLIWQAITMDLIFISNDGWLSLYEADGLRHIW